VISKGLFYWAGGVLLSFFLAGCDSKFLEQIPLFRKLEPKMSNPIIIITHTSAPTSLDPLLADNWNNMIVSKMLFATPIDVGASGQFQSLVLEKFGYDPNNLEIFFEVKPGLKFSDGSPLTVFDICLSILRFARAHPDFPVVKEIFGLTKWIKNLETQKSKKFLFVEKALPEGFTIKDQTLKIKLSSPVENPLFRFGLEVFGIIPSKFVNWETNELLGAQPPSSGPYRLTTPLDGPNLKFEKRPDFFDSNKGHFPKDIEFTYFSPRGLSNLIQKGLPKSTVVLANEQDFLPEELEHFNSANALTLRPFQSTYYSLFILNPKVKPFDLISSRQKFSQKFRMAFARRFAQKYSPEGSLFTRDLPGFVPLEELNGQLADFSNSKLSENEIPTWGFVEGQSSSIVEQTFKEIYKDADLKVRNPPKIFRSRGEMFQAFEKGEIQIFFSYSGFWVHDPIGDVKMLLTPGFHPILQPLTSLKLTQELVKDLDSKNRSDALKKLNEHIFRQSILNPYAHQRPFLIGSNENRAINSAVMGFNSTPPWQYFPTDN
jgi:ABC-type transport system substrate-binding protein